MKTKKSKAASASNGEAEPTATLDPIAPVTYQVQAGCRLTPGEIKVVSNTRTEFGGPEDGELLASVKLHGVRAALWVRRLPEGGYELIAGERRLRAAIAAGLADVPADIYDCDPKTARELQIIENLQRRGISALDEAAAFVALVKDHGYTVADLMAKFSKSKSHICGRMKLVDLPRLGKEALQAGQLSPSVALRVARIPNPAAQKQCLSEFLSQQSGITDREAAIHIEERFMRELKGAPFDREDPALSHRGPCSTCPLRSGNQAELFPDLAAGRADICTDPACYAIKVEAGWNKRAAEHERAGGQVLSPGAASKIDLSKWNSHLHDNGPYVDLDAACYDDPKRRTLRELLGGAIPTREEPDRPLKVTLARANDGSGQIFELVDREAAKAHLESSGAIKVDRSSSSNDGYQLQRKAAREKAKVDDAVHRAEVNAVIARLESMVQDEREAKVDGQSFLLRWLMWVCAHLGDHADMSVAHEMSVRRKIDLAPYKNKQTHDDGKRKWLRHFTAKVTAWQELMARMTDLLICTHACWATPGTKSALTQAAELLGIDLAPIEKETRAALAAKKTDKSKKPDGSNGVKSPPPKPAEPRGGRNPKLSPQARGRIAAAQRARWAAASKRKKVSK